jgi:hypothetical protein
MRHYYVCPRCGRRASAFSFSLYSLFGVAQGRKDLIFAVLLALTVFLLLTIYVVHEASKYRPAARGRSSYAVPASDFDMSMFQS